MGVDQGHGHTGRLRERGKTGMIQRIGNKFRNQKGMTMSSVLVAFAVLSLILLMFWQAVTLSSNLFRKSEDIRRETEALYSGFYENTSYQRKNADLSGLSTVRFSEEGGAEAFAVDTYLGGYNDGGERTVYYFGHRKGE